MSNKIMLISFRRRNVANPVAKPYKVIIEEANLHIFPNRVSGGGVNLMFHERMMDYNLYLFFLLMILMYSS